MKPGLFNIEIFQGTTYNLVFATTDTDIDLTDYDSIRMEIRKNPGGTIFWDSAVDTGGSIVIQDANTIELLLEAPLTDGFRFDEAQYVIELITNGTPDAVDALLYGKVVLNKGTPS